MRTLILVLLGACTAEGPPPLTEIGNPERELGVAAAVPVTPTPGEVTVDSAWASLGEIRLQLDAESAQEHEPEWETPRVVSDLAAGPVEVRFRSPVAGYDLVTIRPREGRDLPAGAPAELRDASFVVEGTRGDGVPFVLRSATREDLVLSGSFDLGEDQTALALGFDLDAWLSPAGLAGATVTAGVVEIDESHNVGLLRAFEAALPGSVRLVEDLDGDGRAGHTDLVLLD